MKFNGTAWVNVGMPAFSADRADNTTLAFAPDGTPYVAYPQDGISNTAAVMRYSGGAWKVVGRSAGWASYISLAFSPDGTPYIAATISSA